jgi:hypothetical protein
MKSDFDVEVVVHIPTVLGEGPLWSSEEEDGAMVPEVRSSSFVSYPINQGEVLWPNFLIPLQAN